MVLELNDEGDVSSLKNANTSFNNFSLLTFIGLQYQFNILPGISGKSSLDESGKSST